MSSSIIKDDTTLVDHTTSSRACDALNKPVCLAHLSDIHVTASSAWTKRDLFSKRITGWINLKIFGRGFRFRNTNEILNALMKDIKSQNLDSIVFSGDATALGF